MVFNIQLLLLWELRYKVETYLWFNADADADHRKCTDVQFCTQCWIQFTRVNFSLIADTHGVLAWVERFRYVSFVNDYAMRCVHPFADVAHVALACSCHPVALPLLFTRTRLIQHSYILSENISVSRSVCKCLKFYPQVWNRFVFTHFAQHTAIRCVQFIKSCWTR